MLRYYLGLLSDIPRIFRNTIEGWLFWLGIGLFVLTALFPNIARAVDIDSIPRWLSVAAIGIALVYGLLRINYERVRESEGRARNWETLLNQKVSARSQAVAEAVKCINELLRAVGNEGHKQRLAACYQTLTDALPQHLQAYESEQLSSTLQHIRPGATGTAGPTPGEEMSLKSARDYLIGLMRADAERSVLTVARSSDTVQKT